MTFPTSISVLANNGVSGLFGQTEPYHTYKLVNSTSTSKQYELHRPNNTIIGPQYGIEIAQNGSTTVLNVNTHSNTGNPFLVSTNLDSTKLASVVLTASTTYVNFWYSSGTSTARINITSSMIFASGPTPATYGAPSGALPSSSNLKIYTLKLEKHATNGYRIRFRQAYPGLAGNFNVSVCYTNTNGVYKTDTYEVVPSSVLSQTIYLSKAQTYLPAAGTVDIKFSIEAIYASSLTTFAANAVIKSFTYVTNDITASFTPDVGTPGTSVTLNVTGSDDAYVATQTATYYDYATNVTTNINKNASGQFDYTQTFTASEGIYLVTHGTSSNELARANYDTNYVSTTTSNGGGKPDRYPLIMTNLFNRNRSIYSIGMTHKDKWDLFL